MTMTCRSRETGERRLMADSRLSLPITGKPVYGLFIANRIDSNTAETFRIGVWLSNNDDKMRLDIIPVTLAQFKAFFEALFTAGRVEVDLIRKLLDSCGDLRAAHEAPAWKREIEQTINHRIASLLT
jgi:AlwI restriction endonuclease